MLIFLVCSSVSSHIIGIIFNLIQYKTINKQIAQRYAGAFNRYRQCECEHLYCIVHCEFKKEVVSGIIAFRQLVPQGFWKQSSPRQSNILQHHASCEKVSDTSCYLPYLPATHILLQLCASLYNTPQTCTHLLSFLGLGSVYLEKDADLDA